MNTYILHTQADNEPNTTQPHAWVSVFATFLQRVTAEITSEHPTFSLCELSSFTTNVLTENTSLILVVSPTLHTPAYTSYLSILEQCAQKGTNIFKAVKCYVPLSDQPTWLQSIPSYPFYLEDATPNTFLEVTDFFTEEAEKSFWLSLNDLAHDILQQGNEEETLSVYLAQVSADFAKKRHMVKRELQRHGYRVLPKGEGTLNSQTLRDQMQKDLARCCLSIHMIGETYGQLLEDQPISIVEFQNLEASQYAKAKKQEGNLFKRFIWLPHVEDIRNERQRMYIEQLNRNVEKQYGSEFLQNHIEDFKTVVLEYLENYATLPATAQTQESAVANGYSNQKTLYLIVDQRDEPASEPIYQWLSQQGYNVLKTQLSDQNLQNARAEHQRNLNACDGLIIFFSRATEAWLISKLQDVLKSPGMGRMTPLQNKAIFTDSEQNAWRLQEIQQRNRQYSDALVILNKGEFSPRSLETFLAEVSKFNEQQPTQY